MDAVDFLRALGAGMLSGAVLWALVRLGAKLGGE